MINAIVHGMNPTKNFKDQSGSPILIAHQNWSDQMAATRRPLRGKKSSITILASLFAREGSEFKYSSSEGTEELIDQFG